MSCLQHRSVLVSDSSAARRSNISETPALVTAQDLFAHLFACHTRRFSYNIVMRANGGIRITDNPILLVSVKNNRSEILSRMEYVFVSLFRATITTSVNDPRINGRKTIDIKTLGHGPLRSLINNREASAWVLDSVFLE